MRKRIAPCIAPCLAAALGAGCSSHPAAISRSGGPPPAGSELDVPSTFSIVACDPDTGDVGVAVQSKFFGVGSVVPWVEAGVGAVATQSYANTTYGPRGLALLKEGIAPEDVVKRLTEADPERDSRQVGIVDARGRAAAYTGKKCIAWAGSRSSGSFAVQGNILVSEKTVEAMAKAFASSRGELAERLVLALEAGQRAGGDARGRQSAAVVVARAKGGYGGFNDRYIDLRVDDHADPIGELERLVEMQLGKDAVSTARKLEHQGHLEAAVDLLREAVRRHPAWDAARFETVRILFKSGRGEDARSELAAAVARAPEYDHYRYRAAEIYAGASLESECLKELRETLALNPEYREVLRREISSETSAFRPYREAIESLLRS